MAPKDPSQAFDQKQMQEFKEAFAMMDQDKDGVINKNDLSSLYGEMGMMADDKVIAEMLKEASGPVNFNTFLTLFANRLTGTDPDDAILNAFKMFDSRDTGIIKEDQFWKILKSKRGTPLKDNEINAVKEGNPPISGGELDYVAFVKLVTTGAADELSKA